MEARPSTEQPNLIDRDSALSFVDRAYKSCSIAVKKVVAENLRQMIEKFAVYQGEFFLIVERHSDSCFRGGPGSSPSHDFDIIITDLWLGIISGRLRFGEAMTPFNFPVRIPYASGGLHDEPTLHEGRVFLLEHNYVLEILNYFQQEHFEIDWRKTRQPGLNIAVGDEEVKNLIRQYPGPQDYQLGDFPLLIPVYKMCLLIGRFLHNFPEQVEYLEKHRDFFEKARKEMRR